MDISWQTTVALACAAVTAAVIPGTLGYATARLESADLQRHEVVRLRTDLQEARRAVQRVSSTCGAEARGTGRGAEVPQAWPVEGERGPRGWSWWYVRGAG